MNNNTKVTLSIAQLRNLINECAPKMGKTVRESKSDEIFHAKELNGDFEYDKSVHVYNNDDKVGRFYRSRNPECPNCGIIYSRHGTVSELTAYNAKTKERGDTISGNYTELKEQIDDFIEDLPSLEQ